MHACNFHLFLMFEMSSTLLHEMMYSVVPSDSVRWLPRKDTSIFSSLSRGETEHYYMLYCYGSIDQSIPSVADGTEYLPREYPVQNMLAKWVCDHAHVQRVSHVCQ